MNIAIYYSDMKEPPTKYTKIFDHTAAIVALSPPPVECWKMAFTPR